MLQRIQSVWLFLASIFGLSGIKWPSYVGDISSTPGTDTLEATDNMPLLIATIAMAVISLVAIFLFKNRSTQIKMVFTALALQLLVFFLYYREMQQYVFGKLTLTSILQFGVVVLLALAIMGISKDNRIIRESNRLR